MSDTENHVRIRMAFFQQAEIVAQCGIDLAPMDPDSKDARERLMSCFWPHKRDRFIAKAHDPGALMNWLAT